MSDPQESYYEIALTNRQVLSSFVVLLGCVLVAFIMGVWVGRSGSTELIAEAEAPPPAAELPSGEIAALEEFKFPSETGDGGLQKPDLGQLKGSPQAPGGDGGGQTPPSRESPVRDAGRPDQTLAQQVGSQPVAPPPPARQSAPPPPARRPPAAAPPPPPTAPARAAEPTEGFIVQVFATRDEVQADKVLKRLRQGGFKAFISPVEVSNLTNYRVRIGPFSSRAPAEQAAAKVNQEYKFETWITAASN